MDTSPGLVTPLPFAPPGLKVFTVTPVAQHVSTHLERSVSQIEQYEGCPMRYYLERVARKPRVPSWSLVGGLAFHDVIRRCEMFGASPDASAKMFAPTLAGIVADTVIASEVSVSDWHKANRGTEGREWWLDKGPEMCARYVEAQRGRNYEIVRLGDDALAVELEFTLRLPGLPPLRGGIDQLVRYGNGDYGVIDLKTGAQPPSDLFQLRVYRLAATELFGLDPDARWFGAYWRARSAELTQPVALDRERCLAEVSYRAKAMHAAENAGLFPARPSHFCSACGVRPHCPAKGDPETALAWSQLPPVVIDAPLTEALQSTP